MQGNKVLILTASFGNGHMQVAKTIEQEFIRQGIEHVVVSNLFAESYPRMNQMTEYMYLKSYSIGQPLYHLFYHGIEKIYDKKFMNWSYYFGKKRLTDLLTKEKPNMIIYTFPMIGVPQFLSRHGMSIPTFSILTDYCLHKIWIQPYIDQYYVATSDLKQQMTHAGVPETNIRVTGIPIRHAFEQVIPPSSIYKKYHISPQKPVILIIAGAHGVLKDIKTICKTLIHEHVQLVVVCGNNEALRVKLQALATQFPERLRVFGYVERIDELFRIATLIVTKPGGITLTEATAMGVPLILYRPTPGQERENALYFSKKGGAIIAENIDECHMYIHRLLRNEEALLDMKYAVRSLHHPHAASNVVRHMLQLASEKQVKTLLS
ncbi:diglucosyl diacylglycerol synthase [Anoxybacillus ayderensis]|uniref:diglucosyl diacylglycerol synthase n=1 Tax=Anoxybacillus ayderensis TaxID=265546 RepID=UPI000A269525|nr:diglucosyl diacylglycerol synthase [Anoxybacillus ayderensis]OSX53552.1 diglucosyl diacylglycerol synthase [Anoxybacillus ayderensis]